jgi:hypothetical protein
LSGFGGSNLSRGRLYRRFGWSRSRGNGKGEVRTRKGKCENERGIHIDAGQAESRSIDMEEGGGAETQQLQSPDFKSVAIE